MALGMAAGCPVRMSKKHLRFVIGPAASGICHVSQVPPYQSQSASASRSCALGTRLSCRAPLQKTGRQRAAGSRNR
ncbi:unnamed protein product [Staurois parvus]|uniref:Uncharacterized protein n=1 Tax=Staurois parvus TaxID=386267 RepID=A0ABN9DG12_9NEOB|nr:unnamed protein product [Staurois parvus]